MLLVNSVEELELAGGSLDEVSSGGAFDVLDYSIHVHREFL